MNLHPEFHRMQDRATKEILLQQRARVFWFYGLSGSGKTTLATALEQRLTLQGFKTKILDGDNIRGIAHVARLFHEAGLIVICSFITPKRDLRRLARDIVGPEGFQAIYTRASFETCAARDVHGLYAKAERGQIKHFTGHGSTFEAPEPDDPDWIIDTDALEESQALDQLHRRILPLIEFPSAIGL